MDPFFWVRHKSVFLCGKEKMARMEQGQDLSMHNFAVTINQLL